MKLSSFYQDKVVLITGASMGIGRELARQVLRYGGKVVITGRNEDRLRSVRAEFSEYTGKVLIYSGNVADYENNTGLIEKIMLCFGRLDIVISNAGISAFGELDISSRKTIDEIVDTNVKGALYLYVAAISELKKTKGSIVFISSIAAFHGLPAYSLYSLTKMALTAMVQSISIECRKYGVFAGIAYLGFTENEPEKRTVSPEGTLEMVPARNKLFTTPRAVTADLILKQIRNRRYSVTHSFIGKVNHTLSSHLPYLVRMIFEKNYCRSLKSYTRKPST